MPEHVRCHALLDLRGNCECPELAPEPIGGPFSLADAKEAERRTLRRQLAEQLAQCCIGDEDDPFAVTLSMHTHRAVIGYEVCSHELGEFSHADSGADQHEDSECDLPAEQFVLRLGR